MQFKLRLIPAATATLMLVACGGGAPAPAPVVAAVPTSGRVVDGYLSFAKVICDVNDNGVADASEPVVYTLVDGKFTFPDGCKHGLIASGGTDTVTGLPFTAELKAPAGATVVTPLTTLIAAGLTQAQVNAALGLPAGTDLLNTDPAATSGAALVNGDLFRKSLAVEQLLQQTMEVLIGLAGATGSATTQPVYNEVAAAFATALAGGAKLYSDTNTLDPAVVTLLVQAAALRVSTATAVSSDVKNALIAINLPALASVAAGGMVVQANTILQASDANLAAATTTAQSSSYITDYIKANKTALSGSPSAATIAALSSTLNSDVSTGTNSLIAGGTVLLSFDEAVAAFSGMGAYGGALPDVVAGPSGGNGNALKIVKPSNPGTTWGGAYFGVAPIPFTATRKSITARVYSTVANSVIMFKVQVSANDFVEIASAPTGPANTWSTATWNFSTVNLTEAYTTIAITPDATRVTDGQTYYLDDITLAPASSGSGSGGGLSTTPTTAAPAPAALAANVISIYSDAYTNLTGTDFFPNWGQTSVVTDVLIAGNATKEITNLNYQGIALAAPIDVSGVSKLHLDVWSGAAGTLSVGLITSAAASGGAALKTELPQTLAAGWNSLDISLTSFTAPNLAKIDQLDLVGTGTIYYDNLYFWKAPAVVDTVPPTLNITDNTTASTATAPVTFTFAFSKDVGASFNISDIVVAGGTAGVLTKVDATHYTLVVTPTANATGTISVSVAAGTFQNTSNISNTAAASASHAFNTVPSAPTDYVSITGDAIGLFDGTTTTSYSMADFQSAAGISVKWPMASTTALRLQLTETGNFTMAPGQTLTAAVQITEQRTGGLGEIRGYIQNVSISKVGHIVTLTVPNPASALIYGVSGDGTKNAVIDFSSAVAGVTNTLTTATGFLNNLVFGDVVAYAVNNVSNDFTGINALRGTYKVTLVVTDLPLRNADGSKFPSYTIQVPTTIGSGGAPGTVVPVTGWGLQGYITLIAP